MREVARLRICVYCSSSSSVSQTHKEAARELGRLIGTGGHSLVYGGAQVGLMGELARAVRATGGKIIGVLPTLFKEHEGLVYAEADELIETESMAERKTIMAQRGEAFVALPGGFGTMEELLEVMTLKQLGYLRGPIVLVNTAGFYKYLLAHFEYLYQQHFAKVAYRQLYHISECPADAMDYIVRYAEPQTPLKWF